MLGLNSEIAKTRSHMTINGQNRNRNILDLYGLPPAQAVIPDKLQNPTPSVMKTTSNFQIDSE